MLFSWTWNEKRKNAIEELNNAYGRRPIVGAGLSVEFLMTLSFLSFSSTKGASFSPRAKHPNPNPVIPGAKRAHILGKKKIAVRTVANLGSKDAGRYLCHLMNTLDAHQKLATLSSNRPLANGKIRMMG